MSIETIQSGSDVDLRECVDVVRRRKVWLLAAFAVTMAACAGFVHTADPIYTTEARLVVSAPSDNMSMVETENPLGELLAAARPDSLPTQLQAMQTGPFLNRAQERVTRKLRKGARGPEVRVENLEGTEIIAVRVTCGDPEYAAEYANAIVNLHLEQGQAQALAGIRDALAFSEREEGRARQSLQKAEMRLLAFRKERKLEELSAAEQSRIREALDLESRVRELGADVGSTAVEVQDLRRALASQPEKIVDVLERENPRLQQLRDMLAELQRRRSIALVDYKPTSPTIQQLDAQIKGVREDLAREPAVRIERSQLPNPERRALALRLNEREAELRRLRAEKNRVTAELATLKRRLPSNLGESEIRLASLTRERDQAQKIHSLFLDRVQDLRIREKAHRPEARVLLSAEPPRRPSFPNPQRMFMIAAVLGLMLGLGCAFLAERLDDRVQTPQEAVHLTQAGMLGHVPRLAKHDARVLGAACERPDLAEAYRTLRSSIAFEALDQPLHTLLITSALRGEGKSLTSVNLAAAMAADGKRVALIDADLRRPNLHKLLHQVPSPGLSDLLTGRATVEQALLDVPAGFSVICAGQTPENPSELLNTPAMEALLTELRSRFRFDLVLVDSSPCAVVTDALILAGKVDGVLMVVDAGHTPRNALCYARDLLARARARVVGTVFNRVSGRNAGYYGRYGVYGHSNGTGGDSSRWYARSNGSASMALANPLERDREQM